MRHQRPFSVSVLLRREVSPGDEVVAGFGLGSVRALLLGRVAEWQTRWLQVPVFARTWGFKSPLAHDRADAFWSQIEAFDLVTWCFHVGQSGSHHIDQADLEVAGRQIVLLVRIVDYIKNQIA